LGTDAGLYENLSVNQLASSQTLDFQAEERDSSSRFRKMDALIMSGTPVLDKKAPRWPRRRRKFSGKQSPQASSLDF